MNNENKYVLEVENLTVHYVTEGETVEAVNDISFSLEHGKSLGIVGETGAGKTTTALSLLRLLPETTGRIPKGEIIFEGKNIMELSEEEMRKIRGDKIAMIFQDPMTALNPVYTVGEQIHEAIALHAGAGKSKEELDARVDEVLKLVGIPPERKKEYPHQFSGGMKQRVVIAIALACHPAILIADEPTTALDVTIQAQVLDMMRRLKEEFQTSMIMITHDLGIVAETCDEVAVMYAGRIIEKGNLVDVFKNTMHPYTEGLFNSLPDLNDRSHEPKPIKGLIPDPTVIPEGCAFAERCPYAQERCFKEVPAENWSTETHMCACLRYDEPDFHIERGAKA